MTGYGALLDSSFGQELRSSLIHIGNLLGGLPFYYYIIALVGLVVLVRLLTK